MWKDLIDQENKYIGGKLIEYPDRIDKVMGFEIEETTITGFLLTDEWFEVKGKDFSCGGSRETLGISNNQKGKGLLITGFGGFEFQIIEKDS